jgi:hypothetical protein
VSPSPVQIVKSIGALPARVAALARAGDLVITLGAGSIGTVADRILDALRGDTPSNDSELSGDRPADDRAERVDASADAGGDTKSRGSGE